MIFFPLQAIDASCFADTVKLHSFPDTEKPPNSSKACLCGAGQHSTEFMHTFFFFFTSSSSLSPQLGPSEPHLTECE